MLFVAFIFLQSVVLIESFKIIDHVDSKTIWGLAATYKNDLIFYNSLNHEIVSMNIETKDYRNFGRKGRGPQEFLNVSQVVVVNDTLFVMDIDTDRLTLLTKDLKFIRSQVFEDFIPFNFGVSDNLIFTRSSSQFNNANIHVLNKKDLSYKHSFQWPYKDEKWKVTLFNTGKMFAKGEFGYYSGSLSNKLMKINLNSLDFKVTNFRDLPDPEFRLEEKRSGRRATVTRTEYTFTGMDISSFGDYIVTGYSGTKFGNYYFLDFYREDDLKYVKTIQFEHPIYDFTIMEDRLFICAYSRTIEPTIYIYDLIEE